ncbi:MAG: MMPL family transporter [Solirubrobacterales bacterium]
MRRFAAIVTGRRAKWAVLALWVVLAFAMSPLGAKLQDETQDDTASFLPESAESTKVVEALDEDFEAGETTQGLIVYQRDSGLTAQDREKVAADAAALGELPQEELPLIEPPTAPFAPGAPATLVAEDGTLAYTVLRVPTDFDAAADWGKNVRDVTGEDSDGMQILLTGDIGFSTDAEEVFGELDRNLLLATVTLVLVLLGSIYRAVLVALTPLLVVFLAYTLAQGLIYLYAKSGATVSSNSTSILIVLMFGVGTDYCLLLVSRYREELHRLADKHDAMSHALARTGPTILASGLTVTLAMLVLALADARNTSTLGPVAAIGVASAMLAGLTLLPALLTIFGRTGFWPRRSVVAYDPENEWTARQGIWRRVGDRVLRSPATALAVTVAVFVAGALGLLAYKVDYSTTNFFKKSVDSVEGFKLIEDSFPAGLLAPTTVLVQSDSGQVTPEDLAAVQRDVEQVGGVASATPTGQVSRDGSAATLDVVLEGDPYTVDALNVVPDIRAGVADPGPGLTALVGGGSAISYDFDQATESDLRLIAPLALLVIAIILAILLRSLVAPVLLIASVVLSFLATLGISMLIIRYVVGDAGVDASIPTFAFIFLVALGIDYTIFLMARVREEARSVGTREGMLKAITATGPVITSAGIILAGTFSVLMALPVTFTFDLGLMVALGILLDTFIVRTIMVPAAVELIGDKVWWPSTLQGGMLREQSDEDLEAVDAGSSDGAPGHSRTPTGGPPPG